MKIVLVTPTLGHGGGERFITELANYWSSINHEVTIVLLRSGASFYPLSDKVNVIELGYGSREGQSKFSKIGSGLNLFFKLRRTIKRLNPVFSLSILSTTNIITIGATLGLKPRIFVNDVMSPYRERGLIERKLRGLLYRKADGVIALTKIAKEIIYKETKSKNIAVIPNPVKDIHLDPNIKKEKIILNVGRLVGEKGQHYLLEAYAKLNHRDWKIVILGEGHRRTLIENLADELKISDRLYMPGATKDIDEWLARASIFAFPSLSESWGLALTESMVAGIPSVSFDCEVGPREMITDGHNGFLVPVKDVDLFAQRIDALINDENLRTKIAQNAKKDAEKYKIEIIGNRILEFCTNS